MKWYRVTGIKMVPVVAEFIASSEEDAIKKAQDSAHDHGLQVDGHAWQECGIEEFQTKDGHPVMTAEIDSDAEQPDDE